MKYLHAIQGAFIALIIFIVAVIYIPGAGPSNEVEIILTISTFLFAIIAGFFISRLGNRYNSIRELIADQDALFLSLYKLSQLYGAEFSKKIAKHIDNFYIVAYDFIIGAVYKENLGYFMELWDEFINNFKKKKDIRETEYVFEVLDNIEKTRNKTTALYYETLSYGQWAILIILSGIILFSIFYLKTEALYSQIITVLLSTALVLVLLIIRDLQNFMLGGSVLLEESGQEVLELIGKKRYYNNKWLKKGINKVPKNVKVYRVGMHNPGKKFNIKVVRR
ncbi:MAG: hypothetical protein ABIE22_04245 [archaeon]